MFGFIKRAHLSQPKTKKKVVELEVGGRIGRWYTENRWGAFTFMLPFVVLIFYWSAEDAPKADAIAGNVRFHEFVHVEQDERNWFFLVSWVRYLWSMLRAFHLSAWHAGGLTMGEILMDAYWGNKYEIEAYTRTREAEDLGLPDWAK